MRFRHDGASTAPPSSASPGGLVVERPPPGLARGKYPASAAAIVTLGSALLLAIALYFYLRLRRTRQ